MKTLLLIILLFVGITAAVSGVLLIVAPKGGIISLPLDILSDSPFNSFIIPGIILAVLVGGMNLLAVLFNFKKHPRRYDWAMAGGVMITGWIVGQMILIKTINWFHIVYILCGMLTILIAYQLKGKWIV